MPLRGFARETLVIGHGGAVLSWRGADCPVLADDVVATEGAIDSRGASYCGSHDVGMAKGCTDVAFHPSGADDDGVRTLDVHDGSHRIFVRASDPSALRSITFARGRYERGKEVTVRWSPRSDELSSPTATLRPLDGSAMPREIPIRFEDDSLAVELPVDVDAGQYELEVRAVTTPRVFQCEGVAACELRASPEQHDLAEQIEIYE